MTQTNRREALEHARTTYGFVPNLMREMVDNPTVVHAYLDASQALTFINHIANTESDVPFRAASKRLPDRTAA